MNKTLTDIQRNAYPVHMITFSQNCFFYFLNENEILICLTEKQIYYSVDF